MTINETQDKIIDEFSRLNDWFDKYEYIIGIGKTHPSPDPGFRVERNALQGCQSQVWICAEVKDRKAFFTVDSDSIIIRGILALLLRTLNEQPVDDIVNADLYFVKKIGLNANLSPARAIGLAAIVRRMKQITGK